ncbi:MAG: HAD family hydrolase [Planctomycetota bacterium]|nr:MAG: HAD family hydrolase [Planctomycetota bacterium]
MSLRAVFFDIDDTLYSSTRFAWRAREQAVAAMCRAGLRVPRERALAELAEVVAEFGSNDDRHYDRLLQRLGPDSHAGAHPALIVMAGVIAYHETKWRELTIPETERRLLADLAAAGLRLGVITAGLRMKQAEKILRLGLDRFLDPDLVFITDQEGIAKTNPKLYLRAAARAGIEPGQAMHVGDHPLHDADTARRAGMIAVLHQGSGKYAHLEGGLEPHHRIDELAELRPILVEYGVDLPG